MMERVPVTLWRWVCTDVTQDERHPHVWNASLVEHFALPLEAELLVEGHRLHLRMQVWFADAEAPCLAEQLEQDLHPDAPAAQTGNDRDSADLTGGVQAAGANWVTVQADEDMNARRILVIPLVGFGDTLFFDENGAADALDRAAVRIPVGERTFQLQYPPWQAGFRGRARAPRRGRYTRQA